LKCAGEFVGIFQDVVVALAERLPLKRAGKIRF
jgi:hypothetical protein